MVGRKFVPPEFTTGLLSSLIVSSKIGQSLGNKPAPPVSGYLTFGSDSRIYSEDAIPEIGTSDFTIEFFANITYTSAQYGESIFGIEHDTDIIRLRVGDEGIIVDDESGTIFECSFPPALFNSWHHYALCRRSGDLDFYVDGSRVSIEPFTTTSAIDDAYLSIGATVATFAFPGKLTNFRITKRALYPGTVPSIPLSGADSILLLLANPEGATTDSSPYENKLIAQGTVTLGRGPVLTTPPIFSQYGVLEFDGGSYLNLDGTINLGTSNFTIEWYMRPTSYGVDVFQIYTSTNLNELFCLIDGSNLVVLFGDNGAGGPPLYGFSGVVTPVLLNEWHKYAIQRISTTQMQVLIDGIIVESFTIPGTRALNGGDLWIGYNDLGDNFMGSITNFRISTGLQSDTLPLSGGEFLLLADPFNPFSDSSGSGRGVDNYGVTNSLGPITVDLSTATILRYNSDQGPSFDWGGTTFTRNTSLSKYSYTAVVDSIPSGVPSASNLTAVTIGNLVVSIGGAAFNNCINLTSVTIGNSVESIGENAFYDCQSLSSVTIGNSVETIGQAAFFNCTSLMSIVIPDSVTSIGNNAFTSCTSLASVTIGNSVESIGNYAFFNCTSLRSIVLPDSVDSIGDFAFFNCTSLIAIVIPDSVDSIGVGAFQQCVSLTSIVLPDSVTSIGSSTFYGCASLTSIAISASVTSISSNAFELSGLTTVTIANGQLGKASPATGIDFFGRTVRTILP